MTARRACTNVHRGSIGTYTCRPRPPEVFGWPSIPSSCSSARSLARHPDRVGEVGPRLRVEVDPQLVGLVDVRAANRPRVERQRAQVRAVRDHRELGRADLVGGAAAGEGDRRGLHVVGRPLRNPLLVERVAPVVRPGGELRALEDPARPALQGGRPIPQRTQDAVADGQEVLHHVEFGQPTLGEVDLVRVADPDAPPAHLELNRRCRPRHPRNLPARRSLRPDPSRTRQFLTAP